MVRAADRFHVSPWELAERGIGWMELALTTLNVEARAATERAARDARRRRMQQAAAGGSRGLRGRRR